MERFVAVRINVVAVVTFAMAACGSTGTPAGSPVVASPVPVVSPTASPSTPRRPAAVVEELDAGGAGWAMTKAAGALWIQVDPPVDAIVRIDVATGASEPAVPLGWKPKAGSDGVWVMCCDWLVRVDATTGEEELRVPIGGVFAVDDDVVWLMNEDGLHRIDGTTGAVANPIGPSVSSVCGSPKDLAVAFDSAWLACKEGKVVRIELSTGDNEDIATASGAHTFAVTDDAVWVTNYQAGNVSRIDPETADVVTIPGAGSGVGITAGGGYVWAAAPTGIAKIDPESNAVIDTIQLGFGEYYELVWDEGFMWASTRGSRILKVDTSAQ